MTTARGLMSALARRLRRTRPHWKRKNSSKISRRCAGRPEPVQLVEVGVLGRKVGLVDAPSAGRAGHAARAARPAAGRAARRAAAPARDARARAASWSSRSRSSRRSGRCGRCAACRRQGRRRAGRALADGVAATALVAGHLRQHLVLRVLQLQPVRRQLELAEEDDALMRPEDVVEKRLVEPDRAQRTRSDRARPARRS